MLGGGESSERIALEILVDGSYKRAANSVRTQGLDVG
jgi:hypothetical protein